MMPIYDTDADIEFADGVDPADWRNLPEPEQSDDDDDEDLPITQDVLDILGFDPDEELTDEQ